MYTFVLVFHSWLRWIVVASGLLATASALRPRPSGLSDPLDRWGLIFVTSLDLQMLLGLLLYFVLSPTTKAIFDNFGASMNDPVARYWAVEHVGTMMLAVVAAHLGRVLARKATTPQSKRRRLLACFGFATLAILARTPWPGMTAGRPLFRV